MMHEAEYSAMSNAWEFNNTVLLPCCIGKTCRHLGIDPYRKHWHWPGLTSTPDDTFVMKESRALCLACALLPWMGLRLKHCQPWLRPHYGRTWQPGMMVAAHLHL